MRQTLILMIVKDNFEKPQKKPQITRGIPSFVQVTVRRLSSRTLSRCECGVCRPQISSKMFATTTHSHARETYHIRSDGEPREVLLWLARKTTEHSCAVSCTRGFITDWMCHSGIQDYSFECLKLRRHSYRRTLRRGWGGGIASLE